MGHHVATYQIFGKYYNLYTGFLTYGTRYVSVFFLNCTYQYSATEFDATIEIIKHGKRMNVCVECLSDIHLRISHLTHS